MYKLIRKFIILFVPIVLLMSICTVSGLYVGDIYPLSYIAQLQAKYRLIKYEFPQQSKELEYKFESVIAQTSQIVLFGSSRTWYFKDYLANKCPTTFYNAGFSAASIDEIELLFQTMIESGTRPQIILLSLDYPNYNAQNQKYRKELRSIGPTSLFERIIYGSIRAIPLTIKNIGILAEKIRNNDQRKLEFGWKFINSGTSGYYYEGDGSAVITIRTINNDYTWINEGIDIYTPGWDVNLEALKSVKNILKISDLHHIYVIGYFPPFRSSFWEKLNSSGQYTYIDNAYEELNNLFTLYNYPLYDFSDVETVGGNSNELYDSWHSGELLSVRMYLTLLRNEFDTLSQYSDIDYIENIIESATQPFDLNIDRLELIENQSNCEQSQSP